MKKNILILFLIFISMSVFSCGILFAAEKAETPQTPKAESLKVREKAIKEIEILDDSKESGVSEYSTLSKRDQIFEKLIETTGIMTFALMALVILLGLIARHARAYRHTPLLMLAHKIIAFTALASALTHLALNLMWRR